MATSTITLNTRYGGNPLIRNDAGICAEALLSHGVSGTQPTIGPPSPTTEGEELDCNDENLGNEIPLHFQHQFREWAEVLHEKEVDRDTGRYMGKPDGSLVDHLGHHTAPFADEWAAASGTQPQKLPSVTPFVKTRGVMKPEWHLSTPPVLLNSAYAAWSVFNPRSQQLLVRLKLETSLNVIEFVQMNKAEYQWASFPVDTSLLPRDFYHSRQWYFSSGGALLIRGLKATLAAGARYCNDQVKLKFSGTEGKLLNVSLVCCRGDDLNMDNPYKHFVCSAVAVEGTGMLPRLQMSDPHFETCSAPFRSVLQDLLSDETIYEDGRRGKNDDLNVNIDKSLSALRLCITSSEASSGGGEAILYLPGKLLLESPGTENSSVYPFGPHDICALKRFCCEYLDDRVSITCSSKCFTITAGSSKRAIAPSASISILSRH